PQSVTATATSDPGLTATAQVTVTPGAATKFDVTGPAGTVVAGSPIPVDVTARDAFGNVATAYGGTVRFTSTDPQAVLPPGGQLAAGVGRFSVTLRTAGS